MVRLAQLSVLDFLRVFGEETRGYFTRLKVALGLL